jgi:glycosyltransferase involved in cell wall biosynthesis
MVEYPLVSVGIPTYNGHNSIIEAVTSVLEQGYSKLEVIISDDCSTDDTHNLCQKLIRTNPQIRYFRQSENIGLTRNFEFVLKQASGDFFMWVAHDDFLEPGILKNYVEFLMANPDYSLVSGEIRYWRGNQLVYHEKDLSLEYKSPRIRVTWYYYKVVQGALYYGLMRRSDAQLTALRNRIGDDWHFVASLAFLGKVKNMSCIGYNKKLGGTSKSFRQYAKVIGASWFAANFPHATIAWGAFSDIFFLSPVYGDLPVLSKMTLATISSMAILVNYYFKIYPLVVGGRIKRLVKSFWGLLAVGLKSFYL